MNFIAIKVRKMRFVPKCHQTRQLSVGLFPPPFQGTDGPVREERSLLRLFRVATEDGEANWLGWVSGLWLCLPQREATLAGGLPLQVCIL